MRAHLKSHLHPKPVRSWCDTQRCWSMPVGISIRGAPERKMTMGQGTKDLKRKMAKATLLLTLLFLTGCITQRGYEGGRLSKRQVAVLRFPRNTGTALCQMTADIDSKPVDNWSIISNNVAILPGQRTVRIYQPVYQSWTFAPMTFNAEANRVYELNVDRCFSDDPFHVWITDKATGRLVAQSRR